MSLGQALISQRQAEVCARCAGALTDPWRPGRWPPRLTPRGARHARAGPQPQACGGCGRLGRVDPDPSERFTRAPGQRGHSQGAWPPGVSRGCAHACSHGCSGSRGPPRAHRCGARVQVVIGTPPAPLGVGAAGRGSTAMYPSAGAPRTSSTPMLPGAGGAGVRDANGIKPLPPSVRSAARAPRTARRAHRAPLRAACRRSRARAPHGLTAGGRAATTRSVSAQTGAGAMAPRRSGQSLRARGKARSRAWSTKSASRSSTSSSPTPSRIGSASR